jgi:hypothetical protein
MRIALLAVAFFPAASCEPFTTACLEGPSLRTEPQILVLDAQSDLPICDGTVTATDGSYVAIYGPAQREQVPQAVNEVCTGYYPVFDDESRGYRPGRYQVHVTAPDHEDADLEVTVVAMQVEHCPTQTTYDVAGPQGDTPGYPTGTVVVPLEWLPPESSTGGTGPQ